MSSQFLTTRHDMMLPEKKQLSMTSPVHRYEAPNVPRAKPPSVAWAHGTASDVQLKQEAQGLTMLTLGILK